MNKKTNKDYQKERREKDPEGVKKYFKDYMRRKRAIDIGEVLLKRETKMRDKVFEKYFNFFKDFFLKNYCIPTTREMLQGLNSKSSKTANTFNAEMIKRGYIVKIGSRFAPTKYLMKLFFNI